MSSGLFGHDFRIQVFTLTMVWIVVGIVVLASFLGQSFLFFHKSLETALKNSGILDFYFHGSVPKGLLAE